MSCPSELQVTGREWLQMLEPLLSGQVVKPKTGSHPSVMIWGALEARLQDVDTIILAGLNEGIWPNTSSNDPFLSRSMKAEIGLEPPERRIGLAAHDFQMGMGAHNVILSRSKKSKSPVQQSVRLKLGKSVKNSTRERFSIEIPSKKGVNQWLDRHFELKQQTL